MFSAVPLSMECEARRGFKWHKRVFLLFDQILEQHFKVMNSKTSVICLQLSPYKFLVSVTSVITDS